MRRRRCWWEEKSDGRKTGGRDDEKMLYIFVNTILTYNCVRLHKDTMKS